MNILKYNIALSALLGATMDSAYFDAKNDCFPIDKSKLDTLTVGRLKAAGITNEIDFIYWFERIIRISCKEKHRFILPRYIGRVRFAAMLKYYNNLIGTEAGRYD